ncbi:hypothetical protein EDD65_11817 [Keratinibaculum paraultunense]|uniref:Uncharacterized protein n=1 Tax=Keratinibaculum paraultunense TaxID=1278232 RepID=A0A4R3KMY7_9FIRM|nr:hypothetical protein [Keratinibaculum paraultunense]QQY79079.1 hypothetical protein JL105_07755 [Keratinibaculum paraultunense]TCS85801.1 hypothetical protein EDD65_11817 [Keratinibaculum paraultunense]
MFSVKSKMKIIITISILLLVFPFPSSIFAQKLDLDNKSQGVDAIPNLKEMPTNKVKSLEKNNNPKIENQEYIENKFKINKLKQKNELTLSQTTETRNSNNGSYGYVTDYLTEEGQEKYIYPIAVEPGEVLHAQLDLPNSNELDYDLYLFEVNPDTLDMTLVDLSQNRTFLNGIEGTAPESVGILNKENTIKEYAVFVVSEVGSSITQPFTLHIGINTNTDNFEADENINWAVNFTLMPVGTTVIDMRSMDTLVDNDWYKFTIPNSKNYDTMNFTLDEDSKNANYKIELYQLEDSQLKKVNISSNGKAEIDSGQYYIRVTSIESTNLSGSTYSLSILPDYQADEIYITGFEGGGYATYQFGKYYRVNGNSTLTINGIAGYNGYVLPDADVSVTVINEHWNPEDLRFRTATTQSDSKGNFTVDIQTSHSTASYSYFISGAISFTHYFDYGYVRVNSGTAVDIQPIYFFAYSIRN